MSAEDFPRWRKVNLEHTCGELPWGELEWYLSWTASEGIRWRLCAVRDLPREPSHPRKDSVWFDSAYTDFAPPDTEVLAARGWRWPILILLPDRRKVVAVAPNIEYGGMP